ncbi:hypothetical protein GCM10020367_69910 [Streptomyces sannanensis]|uniref:Uncharacterized protein n=1 Tax=Streptomyces sannanensis TaxID=285536 RepID=A0ABP6SMP8_9ACTN
MWQLNDNGRVDTLDTSAQLAELRQRVDHLLDRLAANTRLTAAGLGSLDPAKLPNGYSLQIALGPLDSRVGGMRLAREHKYQLLLRIVQRLHQAGPTVMAGYWGRKGELERAAVTAVQVEQGELGSGMGALAADDDAGALGVVRQVDQAGQLGDLGAFAQRAVLLEGGVSDLLG